MTTAKAKRGSFVPNLTSRLTPPLIALILAIVLFLLGGVISPGFVNANQAINIVRLAAFLGIIAAGQTLVIISGGEGIDLSVASIVTLGAILTFRLTDGQDALILPVLGLVMLVGAGIGLVNGLGIVFLRIPPLVMTLAMAGVVQGVILQVTRGELEGETPDLMRTLIAQPLIGPIPGVIFLWIGLGIAMWLLLERTPYGKMLFAVGINRTTAVGAFPRGAATCGAQDMSGNVWEWTLSFWDEAQDRYCVRGGSWLNEPRWLRSAARNWNDSRNRFNFRGFRLARTLTL